MVACGFQVPASELKVFGAVGKSLREMAFLDALLLYPVTATRVQEASAACNSNCEMAYW